MMQNENIQETKTEKMNLQTKIIKIFSDPVPLFENIRLYPNWLIPVLISIFVSIVFTLSIQDILLDFQREAIYENSMIPEEMKDEIIEQNENKSDMRRNLESVGGAVVQVFLVYLVAAAMFLFVGTFFLGGQATFKQVFSMVSWVGLIGCLEQLIKLPMVLMKDSIHVYTSLAVFLDSADKKTVLFQLLNVIDVFTIWKIILWSVGLSVIYRFSSAKGYMATISVYVIYLAITIGISQLF